MRGMYSVAVILSGSLLVLSCEESLPPYDDPREVVDGTVRGRYELFFGDNRLKVDIFLVNTFDETFQARAFFEGEGVITLRRKPSVQKTFTITPDLFVSGTYNRFTGILTMDPGDTVRLTYVWNFVDDNNRDLRDLEFQYVQDPSCPGRMIAREEMFVLRARVKVYDKIREVVSAPWEFALCYVNPVVDPQVCPPTWPEFSRSYCP